MTMTTERRNFLKAVSAAAASTAVLAGTQALAQGNLHAAKAMPYQATDALRSENHHGHLGKGTR